MYVFCVFLREGSLFVSITRMPAEESHETPDHRVGFYIPPRGICKSLPSKDIDSSVRQSVAEGMIFRPHWGVKIGKF